MAENLAELVVGDLADEGGAPPKPRRRLVLAADRRGLGAGHLGVEPGGTSASALHEP